MEKFSHLPKKLRDSISELRSWLPNYDHGKDSFPEMILRVLASLPGGEEVEGVGIEPYDMMKWKEAELLGNMLNAIENREDVQALGAALLAEHVVLKGTVMQTYTDEEVPKKDERYLI